MRDRVRAFVDSKLFTGGIFALILLNTVTLGIETFDLPAATAQALGILNLVCICIFVLEILLKLYAYGGGFFKDGWNIFDTVIVLSSILTVVSFLSSARVFRVFRMFRALRALRAIRVAERLEKLRVIVQALLGALPSVGWAFVLLTIIYYVYAVIGTNLYGDLSPEYFGNLWRSLYTLFQTTMADDLGNVSRPLLESGVGAAVYFISFVVLSSILVLNVIVGVVVDSMSEIKKNRQREEHEAAGTEDLLDEIEKLEEQLERVKNLVARREKEKSTR